MDFGLPRPGVRINPFLFVTLPVRIWFRLGVVRHKLNIFAEALRSTDPIFSLCWGQVLIQILFCLRWEYIQLQILFLACARDWSRYRSYFQLVLGMTYQRCYFV